MNQNTPAIDVWMQHPNLPFINHPMFASLRRWMGMDTVTEEIPAEFTIAAMDQAGVAKGMICAWWGPSGPLISNEEVKSLMDQYPTALSALPRWIFTVPCRQSGSCAAASTN